MPASDDDLERVCDNIFSIDPDGSRTMAVLRGTLDQLYDGQRTGRFRWDQLHKTEKTHCGTLVEINMQREFRFDDGDRLDFMIGGVEVDCKYSQGKARWMIPVEAVGHLILGLWADDSRSSWSMGLVRATPDLLSAENRDRKRSLSADGRSQVRWLFDEQPLPTNTLLQLSEDDADYIMEPANGSERVRRLFRKVQGQAISRNTIATVAQQADYMKRVRYNGGARSTLRPEGIVILGHWESHRAIARSLDVPEPRLGEEISVRLTHAVSGEPDSVELNGCWWRIAKQDDPAVEAPLLPER